MIISKIIIYFILFFIYKIIKKYKKSIPEKENKEKKDKEEYKEEENNKIELPIINKTSLPKSNLNLESIINNFHNKIEINYEEIDPNILKLMNKEKLSENKSNIENLILSDNKENIIINNKNKFFKYNFISKKNFSYKLNFELETETLNNIKLIISNNKKNFTYLLDEFNILKEKINTFSFRLDNNIFGEDRINIYILIYKEEEEIFFNKVSMNIIEKDIVEDKMPLLLIKMNKRIIPFYSETNNIIYG